MSQDHAWGGQRMTPCRQLLSKVLKHVTDAGHFLCKQKICFLRKRNEELNVEAGDWSR